MPTSKTKAFFDRSALTNDIGTPISLLKLAAEQYPPTIFAKNSLNVVLPLLPVTATTEPCILSRARPAKSYNALKLSGTFMVGMEHSL